MYQHILIPVENSLADETILTHIKPLARMTARNYFLSTWLMAGWPGTLINSSSLKAKK